MKHRYFNQVAARTGTRLWVNNPTIEEAKKAINSGAVACTTNPTYVSRLLKNSVSAEEVLRLIDEAISQTSDDSQVASLIQRKLIAGLSSCFLPYFKSSKGKEGFVSLQMDPRLEHDPSKIVAEALADFELFPNCIAKIPVTLSGLAAIDCLVRLNKPVIATEIMAISQAITVCGVYRKASSESGNYPAFFVTHISGILDEHIKSEAESSGTFLSPEALRIAGCAVAKKQYNIMIERKSPGILLGGGARDLHHFTEMVGGNAHVTLNWTNYIELLEENPTPVENLMDNPVPKYIIEELIEKSPTFKIAYSEDELKPEKFEDFGPVVRFRNQFLDGWKTLMDTIGERRKALEKSGKISLKDVSIPEKSYRGYCKVGENIPVEMRPGIYRSTLVYNNENMICHFREEAGARVDLHTHEAIQVGFILKGKVKFFNEEGKEYIMESGHGYLFNSNEPHGSVALEETELVECFTPMRPEYLD